MSKLWLSLTVVAHPTIAVNSTDGYSIILTPEADNTAIDTPMLASEESAEQGESARTAIEDNVQGNQGRRGLQNFACFQYSDSLVAY